MTVGELRKALVGVRNDTILVIPEPPSTYGSTGRHLLVRHAQKTEVSSVGGSALYTKEPQPANPPQRALILSN